MRAHLEAFYYVILERWRQKGWAWFFSGLARRVVIELLWLVFLPVSLLGHLLGYRWLYAQTWHIGHLAADIDTFLKESRLGLLSKRRWFLTAPDRLTANVHLLRYWREFIPVVSDPLTAFALELISWRWFMKEDLTRYISKHFGTQDIYRINRLWGDRSPILRLNKEDHAWVREELESLGLKKDQWFVCVHVREGSYFPKNEPIQSHRNASIMNTVLAMKEIVRRGGACIRMGDPGMTPLPPIEGVIDYAHHSAKSERLDIALCAQARFFLGCTSGLSFVSAAFGVPVAFANMIPVETLGIRRHDLSMPKLLWSEPLNRHLRFDEIFNSKASGYFFTYQYQKAGILPEENSPEDIYDITVEMLDRLDGCFYEKPEDHRLQAAYKAFFKPGHYSYGSDANVCAGFLKRHKDLFGNNPTL